MAQKLEAKGGKKGGVWDDGVHDGIRKVYVGQGQDCIAFVKFEYVDGSEVVVGDEHGKKTLLGTEEVIIIYTVKIRPVDLQSIDINFSFISFH